LRGELVQAPNVDFPQVLHLELPLLLVIQKAGDVNEENQVVLDTHGKRTLEARGKRSLKMIYLTRL
jgi:hypothetical protein